MAIGISGSNGGIGIATQDIQDKDIFFDRPLEVSYFVNNVCNLACKHCYVGYENPKDSLTIDEWKKTFDTFLEHGGLTFGNVGKEALLAWKKSIELLNYFKSYYESNKKIRYGLVTNATLLDEKKIDMLAKAGPTYIDISIDGPEPIHNT